MRLGPATGSRAGSLRPGSAQLSHERLYQDAMLVAADHEVRTRTPPAVLVEVPLSLDSLHGCATLVARRRGSGDQLVSGHSVPPRLRRLVEAEDAEAGASARRPPASASQLVCPRSTRVVLDQNPPVMCGMCRHVAPLAKGTARQLFTHGRGRGRRQRLGHRIRGARPRPTRHLDPDHGPTA